MVGSGAAPPYTLLDDACTTRRTPASSAAFRTVSVPWVFTVSVISGCSTERSTALCAAWWNTTSHPGITAAHGVLVGDRPEHEAGALVHVLPEPGLEVVEHDHLVVGRDERVDEVRADEARAPRHQNLHDVPTLLSAALRLARAAARGGG